MPASIFPHPHFESLMAALPTPGHPAGPFLRPLVVPSLMFADYVQGRMADRFGVCMGMEFLMPQDFIHRAVGPGRNSSWSKRRLIWQVLPHVAPYGVKLGLGEVPPRDRLALAGLITDRFDQYSHFRPEMLRRWAEGKWAKDRPAEQEDWQRELWLKLCDEIEETHPALAMAQLRHDENARLELAARFPDLLVLGTGALDPLLIEVLQLLSGESAQVTVHVVLPSMDYLGDLRNRRDLPAETADPGGFSIAGRHPLLESMGRHAIGTFHLLGKLDEQYTHWPEARPQPAEEASLLNRMQSDIRNLRQPGKHSVKATDLSLRIHSCFGPRREMETLRDELRRAFDQIPNLQPDEVHIVTADPDTYSPLVSAVLRQGEHALPVRLTELPPADGDPLADGLLALLAMVQSGRFEAAEVMDLLEKPAVLHALGEEDPAELRRWIRDCGLTHGLESASSSRDRLMAGRWFGPDAAVRYPDKTYVLPVADQLGGGLAARERFGLWLARLEALMQTWKTPAPTREWAERLSLAVQDLLSGPEADTRAVVGLAAFLAEQNCKEALDAGAVLDWMTGECEEAGRRVRLSGGIAFGRFKQLQNLPCRVLAMVGMHDANFPARNRDPAWDLLKADPRIWDRNSRIDDRQLFLDALLTPSERLIITANTRNLRTMETEPLSSCVDELLRVAKAMGAEHPVIKHRLQPFAADYFHAGPEGLPPSYDEFHVRVAEAMQSEKERAAGVFWTGEQAEEIDIGGELTVERLAKFWKDPAAAYIRACGIFLPREEESDEDLNRSPLDLDGLQSWQVQQAILEGMLQEEFDENFTRSRMAANRQLPPGKMAGHRWDRERLAIEPMATALKQELGGFLPLNYQIENGPTLTAALRLTKDEATLLAYRTGKLEKPSHFLPVWIQALIASACGNELPTKFYCTDKADNPVELPAMLREEAEKTLQTLVKYYQLGQTRPLCFAPVTSECLASESEMEAALSKAEEKWSSEKSDFAGGGEGQTESAKLAWRGRNPFENPDDQEEWIALAEAIATPLSKWRTNK